MTNRPESSHDQAIAYGERAGEVTPDVRCMGVVRTFAIGEVLAVLDYDLKGQCEQDAKDETALTPQNILKALKHAFPTRSFYIDRADSEHIEPMTAKYARELFDF